MPQWTFAFNFVTLTALLRVQPLLAPSSSAVTSASSLDGASTAAAVLGTAAAADPSATTTTAVGTLLLSPLTGLSQIFVVESALTGAGIVAAIASYSPALAAHAVAGSVTGSLVGGLFLGSSAAPSEIAAGLWGFNSALTSMGVGVFFVPTIQSTVLSIAGAAATAAVFGALQPVFGALGSPCLTLPFCLTMSACWALGSSSSTAASAQLVPGLVFASNPHSPEKNMVKT